MPLRGKVDLNPTLAKAVTSVIKVFKMYQILLSHHRVAPKCPGIMVLMQLAIGDILKWTGTVFFLRFSNPKYEVMGTISDYL